MDAHPEQAGSRLWGRGEMARRIHAADWSATELGPISSWPAGLATMVGVMLGSPRPMIIWWGERLRCLYNDAAREVLPAHHPAALGGAAGQIWAAMWPVLGPQVADVLNHGAWSRSEHLAGGGLLGHSVTLSPIPDGGRIGGVLVTSEPDGRQGHAARERTDLLAREQEARRAADRSRAAAEQANRTKDEFLAILGHELRNPLSPIATTLQVMRLRGMASPELDVMDRQVSHLTRLVDDLLDISRITRGKIELRRTPIESAEIIAAAVEVASPLLERRRDRVVVDVPQRGLEIDVDPDRMVQVVANLLTNAAKYSDAGSQIEVRATRRRGEVRISVRDHGIGIDPEMQAHVFEMFVQQPQQSDRTAGGLGLGLAIVKSLVTMHGGSVAMHSAGVGKGSEFSVVLPAVEAMMAVAPSIVAAPAVARPAHASRILVVDDNADVVLALQVALKTLGHVVATAHDGPSALRTAEAFRPEIALLDIGLPAMDGYELGRLLRERHGAVHLVAITGYGQDSDRQRSADAGFARHLVKPVDVLNLDQVVRDLAHPVA